MFSSGALLGSSNGEDGAPTDYEGFWTLNTDSTDSSINGYDGTDTNMTYDGTAAVYNGSSSNIQVDGAIVSGQSALSVSFWSKMSNLSVDRCVLGGWATDNKFLIYHDPASNERWRLLMRNEDETVLGILNSQVTQILDEYTHITFTWTSGGTIKMYKGKTLVAESGVVTMTIGTVGTLHIGQDQTGTRDYIDELSNGRIYRREISAIEVSAIDDEEAAEHAV